MFGLGFSELVVVLLVALIVLGPGKLPAVGKALGQGIAEFRRASRGFGTDDDEDDDSPRLAG